MLSNQKLLGVLAYAQAALATVTQTFGRLYKTLVWAVTETVDTLKLKELHRAEQAQMGRTDLPGVMIVLVVAGVIGFIGLQVMSTTIDTTGLTSGEPLYNASESLQDAVNSAWGLLGVAFIVVILAVIVVYLYGLRGGR